MERIHLENTTNGAAVHFSEHKKGEAEPALIL
jgi:hypothetical protein